jgi:hypothetical protein
MVDRIAENSIRRGGGVRGIELRVGTMSVDGLYHRRSLGGLPSCSEDKREMPHLIQLLAADASPLEVCLPERYATVRVGNVDEACQALRDGLSRIDAHRAFGPGASSSPTPTVSRVSSFGSYNNLTDKRLFSADLERLFAAVGDDSLEQFVLTAQYEVVELSVAVEKQEGQGASKITFVNVSVTWAPRRSTLTVSPDVFEAIAVLALCSTSAPVVHRTNAEIVLSDSDNESDAVTRVLPLSVLCVAGDNLGPVWGLITLVTAPRPLKDRLWAVFPAAFRGFAGALCDLCSQQLMACENDEPPTDGPATEAFSRLLCSFCSELRREFDRWGGLDDAGGGSGCTPAMLRWNVPLGHVVFDIFSAAACGMAACVYEHFSLRAGELTSRSRVTSAVSSRSRRVHAGDAYEASSPGSGQEPLQFDATAGSSVCKALTEDLSPVFHVSALRELSVSDPRGVSLARHEPSAVLLNYDSTLDVTLNRDYDHATETIAQLRDEVAAKDRALGEMEKELELTKDILDQREQENIRLRGNLQQREESEYGLLSQIRDLQLKIEELQRDREGGAQQDCADADGRASPLLDVPESANGSLRSPPIVCCDSGLSPALQPTLSRALYTVSLNHSGVVDSSLSSESSVGTGQLSPSMLRARRRSERVNGFLCLLRRLRLGCL